MIGTVIGGLLIATAAGVPLAIAFDPSSRGTRLMAEAFLFGAATAASAMYILALVGIRWTLSIVLMVVIAVAGSAALRVKRHPPPCAPQRRENRSTWTRLITHVADGMSLLLVGGYAIWATPARPWHADYWVIWGMKARVFFEHGGIDWEHLRSPYNFWTHPDYPPLLPLFYDFLQLFQPRWDDRWFGIVSVAFAVASLLVLRSAVEEVTRSSMIAAWTTLAGTLAALNVFVGMAEPPLMAYAAAGLFLLRRGVVLDDQSSFRSGAVLLGFSAFTKNEGLALLAAATLALAVSTRSVRRVARMWPGWVVGSAWQIVRLSLGLSTDLFEGALTARIVPDAKRIRDVFAAITRNVPAHRLFWIMLVVALVLGWRAVVRERLIALTITFQLLFYVASYFLTPHDVLWHASTSWTRLLIQIAIPLTALAAFAIAETMHPTVPHGMRKDNSPRDSLADAAAGSEFCVASTSSALR